MEVFRKEALNSYLMISNLDNSIGYFVEVYAINSFGSSKQSMRISIPAEDKVRIGFIEIVCKKTALCEIAHPFLDRTMDLRPKFFHD